MGKFRERLSFWPREPRMDGIWPGFIWWFSQEIEGGWEIICGVPTWKVEAFA